MLQIYELDDDDMGNAPGTAGLTNASNDMQYPKKRAKRIILARCTEDGALEEIPPTDSLWWNLYVACPNLDDKRFLQKFRRRFRLPYPNFIGLVDNARQENWFPRWS
jgi:hypothetical protein